MNLNPIKLVLWGESFTKHQHQWSATHFWLVHVKHQKSTLLSIFFMLPPPSSSVCFLLRLCFSPHINPGYHQSLRWNCSIRQSASDWRLLCAPNWSRGNHRLQVQLLTNNRISAAPESPMTAHRFRGRHCHTKLTALNSMIMWPAAGL